MPSLLLRSHFAGVIVTLIVLLSSGCIAQTQPVTTPGIVQRVMRLDGIDYPYVVFAPSTYNASMALPSVLLVHGAGGNGVEILQYWRDLAEAKGIILIAPTLDLSAEAETQVPIVFPKLMQAAQREWTIDPTRRFLFGYSAGGYFAYDAALLSANTFAGAAIFASVIQPAYDEIARQASRKTSIAIYLGDHDQYFTLAQGRRTRDLLTANGVDVHYVELSGHDHQYGAVANFVNTDAWQYLTSRVGR